jgi:hypothetical protein
LSAKELEPIIVVYRSFYSKAFAVLAVITCIIPFLGVFTGLLASLFNFRRRGWLRRLSFASLLISIVPTLFILNTI